jgi:hypothetical protein
MFCADTFMIAHNHSFKVSVPPCFLDTGSCCVAQNGLKLSILLPWPPKCWDYRCKTPRLATSIPLYTVFPLPASFKTQCEQHSLQEVFSDCTYACPLRELLLWLSLTLSKTCYPTFFQYFPRHLRGLRLFFYLAALTFQCAADTLRRSLRRPILGISLEICAQQG